MKLSEARRYLDTASPVQARKVLIAKRESVGLSQIALAKLPGVPQSNVNKIENGKQAITSRTWARMITAIEKVSTNRTKKNELERRIADAQAHVAMCKLPWMRQGLPHAEAELAKLELEAKGESDAFSNPHVSAVIESLKRELAQATLPAVEKWVDHDYCESVLNGEAWAVEAQNQWRKTGIVQTAKITKTGETEE